MRRRLRAAAAAAAGCSPLFLLILLLLLLLLLSIFTLISGPPPAATMESHCCLQMFVQLVFGGFSYLEEERAVMQLHPQKNLQQQQVFCTFLTEAQLCKFAPFVFFMLSCTNGAMFQG